MFWIIYCQQQIFSYTARTNVGFHSRMSFLHVDKFWIHNHSKFIIKLIIWYHVSTASVCIKIARARRWYFLFFEIVSNVFTLVSPTSLCWTVPYTAWAGTPFHCFFVQSSLISWINASTAILWALLKFANFPPQTLSSSVWEKLVLRIRSLICD